MTVSVEERKCRAEARLGQRVLGKWRLDRLVGVGGMAAVFEATHLNGSRVAIKILHRDLAGFDEIRERFLAEGYAANRVSHPGVVTVRDEGTTDDGAVFLVMDLLQGQTLAERLRPGAALLSVGEVLEIASQLLDVLEHAHDRGIVHRDVKPENVFLTRDGRVRLLDFGIARISASARTHAPELGTTLGTPAFMAPEQALGRFADLDGRSDLWSLGATLYQLLSGCPVRESGSATEQLLAAMIRPVPSLGEITTLPGAIVAVVDRALAFDREDRFPDARSMQLAVLAAQEELSAPDSRASLAPPSLAPMALSLRTPATSRGSTIPIPTRRAQPSRSALPVYVTLGFALGIGIVVTARINVEKALPEPVALPERAAAVVLPEPSPVPAASPSAAPRVGPSASASAPAAVPSRVRSPRN